MVRYYRPYHYHYDYFLRNHVRLLAKLSINFKATPHGLIGLYPVRKQLLLAAGFDLKCLTSITGVKRELAFGYTLQVQLKFGGILA